MSSKANSAFHPSGVGKWVPASAGKAKAGMVHSVSGWTWGVQVKLWDPWECMPCLSALEVCSRQGIIQIHVYLTLPLRMAATILSWSEVPLHCWDCTVLFGAHILSFYEWKIVQQLLGDNSDVTCVATGKSTCNIYVKRYNFRVFSFTR